MKLYFKILILSLILIACNEEEDPTLSCDGKGNDIIVGSWHTPRFISTGNNCYKNECITLDLELKEDDSYRLSYSIQDTLGNANIIKVEDQGNFQFICEKSGRLSGRYSFLLFSRGRILFNSNSLPTMEWTIERNGFEGLIIFPENFGFNHHAYITLKSQ